LKDLDVDSKFIILKTQYMRRVRLVQDRVRSWALTKRMLFTFHKGGQTKRLSIAGENCVTANGLPGWWSLSVQTTHLKRKLAFMLHIQEAFFRALFLEINIFVTPHFLRPLKIPNCFFCYRILAKILCERCLIFVPII